MAAGRVKELLLSMLVCEDDLELKHSDIGTLLPPMWTDLTAACGSARSSHVTAGPQKALGSRRVRKIARKPLAKQRQQAAAKGGSKKAGNGASQAQKKKKEATLRRHYDKSGCFMSRRQAGGHPRWTDCVLYFLMLADGPQK